MDQTKEQKNEPTLIGTISIDFYEDGSTRIRNFPHNVGQSINIFLDAIRNVIFYFLEMAVEGKMERLKPQRILTPGMKIDPKILANIKFGRGN